MPSAREIRAGAAYIELSTKDSALVRGLDKAEKRLRGFAAAATDLGKRFAVLGSAITAPLAASIVQFGKAGDALNKMSARTGVAVQSLSELKFVAEQNGAAIGDVEKGLRGMVKTVRNADRGLSTASDALEAIGLSSKKLAGLSPEQQFEVIADGIAGIADDGKRAAVAMEIFGRAGSALLPTLQSGSAGIAQLRKETRDLGITMDGEQAQAAADFTDAWNRITQQLRAAVIQIGGALAPAITKISSVITPVLKGVIDWIKQNGELIKLVAAVGAGLLAAGAALIAFGVGATVAATVLGGMSAIVSAVGTAIGILGGAVTFLLSPVGLAVIAATALTVWLVKLAAATEPVQRAIASLGETLGNLAGIAKTAFGGIADALATGDISAAIEIVKLGLVAAWYEAVAKIRARWADFKEFFLNTVDEIRTGLAMGIVNASATVESVFAKLSSSMAGIWDNLVTTLQRTFIALLPTILNVMSKAVGAIQSVIGIFDEDLAAKIGATATAFQTLGPSLQRGIEEGLEQRTKQRATDRQNRLDQIEAGRSGTIDTLGDDLNARKQERGKLFDTQRDAAFADAKAAKAELDRAVQAAADARQAVENQRGEQIEAAGSAAAVSVGRSVKSVGSLGGFSGADVARNIGLSGFGDKQDETNRLLGKVAKNTKQKQKWN